MPRTIATKGDVYGPGASFFLRDTLLNGNPQAPGNGIQTTSQAVPVTTVFANLQGSIFSKPLTWLFGVIGVLIAYKLIEEHRGGRESFEEIKLGLNNVVKIGLVAMVFFVIARFLTARYQVPGFSSFVQYATGG